MAKHLNPVEAEITLAGKKCYLKDLTLTQQFNAHHTFRAKIDYEELESLWMESPGAIFGMVGEEANIELHHHDGSGVNLFRGIITSVEYEGENGEQNYVVFYGSSPTIRLDGKKTMDSFMDKDLSAIVDEAVGNSGNGGSVSASPAFGGVIDYICQYEETCFGFLNRLSWLYGEWFYYDGTTCYFGKPKSDSGDTVTYDIEMNQLKFRANLIPSKVTRYHYLIHGDKEIAKETPDSVPGVAGYQQVVLSKSDSVYTSDADLPSTTIPSTMSELEQLVKVEKGRSTSDMLILEGHTTTSKIAIGKEIMFKLPSSMRNTKKEIGSFLIIGVGHCFDQSGKYYNTFTAIPAGMETIPMAEIKEPKAFPQIATVKTNADDKGKGRVKIQFQWQKAKGKTTNWIRVQTPDAGASDKVSQNRGFVFIPEDGDMVMAEFEYGDPSRPYVTGSIFSDKSGGGGGAGNKTKGLTSRTGSTITLNDEEGSVVIRDKSGSESKITLDGEKNITIDAEVSLTINIAKGASVLKMDDEGNIELTAKTIRMNASDAIHLNSEKYLELEGKNNAELVSDKQVFVFAQSKDVTIQGSGGAVLVADKGEIHLN